MNFISRSSWGALPPAGKRTPLPGPVQGVAVHWEGPTLGTFDHSECAGRVRSIQRFHLHTRKWSDIAYNWIVCPHGYIFEGRGWGIQSAAQGTNVGNARYHAACYLGGVGDPFTGLAKLAYVGLVAEARRRWPQGQEVQPHGYFHATQCPGDVIEAWLATNPFDAPAPPPIDPPEVPEVATYIVWNPDNSFLVDNNTKVYIGGALNDVRALGRRLFPDEGFVEVTLPTEFVSRIPDAS